MSKILSSKAKKKLSFCIHPDAKNAFDYYHSIKPIFDPIKLKPSGLQALYQDQIFRASYLPDGRIGLISGFEIVGFSLILFNKNDACIVIDKGLTSEQISKKSWFSVLRVLYSSLDQKYLEAIRLSLNDQLPHEYFQDIHQADKLTQKHVSILANVSVSGLKKQPKTHTRTKTAQANKPDLISLLRKKYNEG